MINLQPLIEKFKKAVYGRDVRQSIVDLAQAIGDNHNEQEGLRDEVKSLDSDIKVKKEEAEQAINIAISSVNSAKTEAEESINATINTLNTGKEEIENLANAKGRFLEIKFQSLKQMLADFATTKDEEIRNTADGKIDEITTTATTESDKIKVVTTTANESKTALESTIQQSESSKTSLDSTIQRGTAKDQELEAHIAEINQIIADGKAVTKRDLLNVERLIPPEILAIDADGFIWYISRKNINFHSTSGDIGEKTYQVEAYCNIKLSEVKEEITRDGIKASLNISGWDMMLTNNTPFITPGTQVFVNIAGLKEARLVSTELKESSVNVCWELSKDEETGADARIFVKLVSFY